MDQNNAFEGILLIGKNAGKADPDVFAIGKTDPSRMITDGFDLALQGGAEVRTNRRQLGKPFRRIEVALVDLAGLGEGQLKFIVVEKVEKLFSGLLDGWFCGVLLGLAG